MRTGVAKPLSLIGTLAFLLAPDAWGGVVFNSLYSLSGYTYATLAQSGNGTYLYGTTVGTGVVPLVSAYGSVFAAPTNEETFPLGPPVFTNLSSFALADGGGPRAGVIVGPAGYLYGSAAYYAISNKLFTNGMGSLYLIRTNGVLLGANTNDARFSLLYRFGTILNAQGQPLDGANPEAALANGPGNYLYGTTCRGGSNGYASGGLGFGTAFKVATNSVLTELHSFLGSDGSNPTGLTLGRDTNFYGVATYGGSNTAVANKSGNAGFGAIFKMTTNGLTTVLYSFGAVTNEAGNALDGAQPNPLIQGTDGNFYGTTIFGGSNTVIVDSSNDVGYGTVFKISTNGGFTSLYSFGAVTNSKGVALDGGNPAGPLAEGPDGNFYGVTQYGGATNTGTIFVITPAGALTTLYTFGHTNTVVYEPPLPPFSGTGNYPRGGLLVGADHNLYGTTYSGGPEEESQGSVFRLGPAAPDIVTPPAAVTIEAGATNSFSAGVNALYAPNYQWQFNGTNLSDGGEIAGSATTNLILAGVTLADSGTYTILASNVAGTAKASGALTVVPALINKQPAGATIVAGATNSFAVGVLSLYPPSFQWQFDGTNLTDGGAISGSATSNLTVSGAATSNSGTYSVVISNAVGAVQSTGATLVVEPFVTLSAPASLTVMAGATAAFGVSLQNVGAINYQWQFDGTNLFDSRNILGSGSNVLTITNALPVDSGTYSVTASNAAGSETWTALLTVIPQTSAGFSLSNLHSFNANVDGAQPNGLTLGSDGALYGTTAYGGSNGLNSGTFFKFSGGALTTLYSFTGGSDQADPDSALVQGSNGLFYGTTWSQISGQDGTVFEVTTNGTLTTLATFDGTNGDEPNAVTLGNDGNLYGTAYQGGTNGAGTVFEVNLVTDTLVPLVSCGAVATGNFPYAGLTLGSDGNFYGTTAQSGTVFEMDTNGVVDNVYYFLGAEAGQTPLGALVQTSDGTFYGTTSAGGTNGAGTVFKFTPGGGITTLYSFGSVTNWDGSLLDGVRPFAGLVPGPDGSLYGTTYSGGYSNNGTVFKITTNGALTTVAWLDGADGSGPAAPLALGPDGNFYGTAQNGGANGSGAIFQLAILHPPPQIQTVSTAGGMINLAWSVIPGQSYIVQFSTNLSQGNWTNFSGPSVAIGSQLNISDSLSQSQCFYRVIQIPAP
jgi:uncharacterized repeat protein (TIGR03803 family)